MTALLEKLIAIVAPHTCLVCSIENNILCSACAFDVFAPLPSACIFCSKPTVEWRICVACSKKTKLASVYVAGEYGGVIAEVLQLYKFERAKAAHKILGSVLDSTLPYLDNLWLIVPLPTAHSRARVRGYDQSVLLAEELARLRGLRFERVLARLHSERQLGAGRKQRKEQAARAYSCTNPKLVKNKRVLLIDDISTTGASLSAAADLIHRAGASQVNAAVVAWQKLKV
jgi:ComF family protein